MIFVVLVVDWRLFFVLCSRCCFFWFLLWLLIGSFVHWLLLLLLLLLLLQLVLQHAVGATVGAATSRRHPRLVPWWEVQSKNLRGAASMGVCVCVWTWWASATMSSSPAPIISSSLNEALTARGIDTSEFLLRISKCPQSYLLQLDVTPFNAQGKMVQTRSRQWGVVAHSSVLLVWPQTSKIL